MAGGDELTARLAAGEILILDGGTASELQRRGVRLSNRIWSARAVDSDPDVVRRVHADYINAGADIITTNTYSTGRTTLARSNEEDRTGWYNRTAVRLAVEAREQTKAGRRVFIAGSMSPCAPELAVDPQPDPEVARAQYEEQAGILGEDGVDLILLETFFRLVDLREAVKAASVTGLPFWVSLSTEAAPGGDLLGLHGVYYTGETITQAVDVAKPFNPGAFLVNHTPPARTAESLRRLRQLTDAPLGAYAHIMEASGATEKEGGIELGKPLPPPSMAAQEGLEEYGGHARGWIREGAQIIGGCCGVTPDHIRWLREHLPAKVGMT